VNDEYTLRKRRAATDVYEIFKGMLTSGYPPNSFENLLKQVKGTSSPPDQQLAGTAEAGGIESQTISEDEEEVTGRREPA
jgi:hypothetical protein